LVPPLPVGTVQLSALRLAERSAQWVEPVKVSTRTAHLLDELALHGHLPGQDEPDPRPLLSLRKKYAGMSIPQT
jgi:hypothetical protein